MEIRLTLVLALLVAALGVVANALSIPSDALKDNQVSTQNGSTSPPKKERSTLDICSLLWVLALCWRCMHVHDEMKSSLIVISKLRSFHKFKTTICRVLVHNYIILGFYFDVLSCWHSP